MSRKKILLFTMVLTLLLISFLVACAGPATTSQSTTATPTATATAIPADGKPHGELVAALQSFGNENFLPWLDPKFADAQLLVYDMLIYWDHKNFEFLPGLAESWEVSADALTLTYHLRKGVEFHDGWGELTSEDVKYTLEMQASSKSVGKVAQTRRIASMDASDPYTLVITFKDPYPTFYVDLSMGNSGVCQGIVSKKYVEAVGEIEASRNPIGTGPYRLVGGQAGSYYDFEAFDTHWRVVPEFKTINIRLINEISSYVAALKNHEIDLSEVPASQLDDLKKSGVAVEVNPIGGSILMVSLGGMVIPEDKRYDAATHNKDPWADTRVRKAMAMAIDRAGIAKAIYAGYAQPAGVPMLTKGVEKYQYPYDPEGAKKLLAEAGYAKGFSFNCISSVNPLAPETPRVMEALAAYWEMIGLSPKIVMIDYNTYYSNNTLKCKTAGNVNLIPVNSVADQLAKAELFLFPNVASPVFMDEGSYAIYKAMSTNATFEERMAVMDQLNQYYYDNVGPIPVLRTARCFAWNSDKILPFPHASPSAPLYLEYVRHAQPLNTFRLFTPWPER